MTQCLSVYVLAASQVEGKMLARTLMEERLAPCANIYPGIQSIYLWKDKMEEADECAIIFKTTALKFEALKKRIKELHSYECPCIVAWPIVAGDDAYLSWLRDN